ncbi:glycosyltransferase [Spirosoma sp. BT702]|uniref:Glycosyltransferase n=1 Tax=Spirosoma profusum TaxID=2771354 RepID=A0A927ARJ8_9BACT|nr:glycosyltransferase [Spirosoma profusum]MBD2702448.1 glycosyltransferase [Spirosoma profusum]
MSQFQPIPNSDYGDAANTHLVAQNAVSLSTDRITDLLCFSHLRWNFVYQRPQHLLSRASQQWRVWFIEEPIYGDTEHVVFQPIHEKLIVITPHLKHGTSPDEAVAQQREALDQLISQYAIQDFIAWYYTPMALTFSEHLHPRVTIYDCMDELSAFLGAPANLLDLEKELLKRANLVFTGGLSLFEAKQHRHPNVFAFPSSIDFAHFEPARHDLPMPADLATVPEPRIGFCGVIDERMNIDLLRIVSQRRPDWQFVMLGPVVKIDPATLPQSSNIHYLGFKDHKELPTYFSHWDVAIMPFAINEATRYISPTKTPEYLAAGLPVVSTPIHDVVNTYGDWATVQIAQSAQQFEEAIARALTDENSWEDVDNFLLANSWDTTWMGMNRLIQVQLALVFQ